ncbi:hypothetical protein EAG_05328 [Camponotus floridanus]|uniref:Uncharacterized protein n=1 Tax=Camponotus floridanus TaxID=104421 RepID=E2A069_CAMFO|nr:hypothetical protein EAG_05328 [Camponotus floridanus]
MAIYPVERCGSYQPTWRILSPLHFHYPFTALDHPSFFIALIFPRIERIFALPRGQCGGQKILSNICYKSQSYPVIKYREFQLIYEKGKRIRVVRRERWSANALDRVRIRWHFVITIAQKYLKSCIFLGRLEMHTRCEQTPRSSARMHSGCNATGNGRNTVSKYTISTATVEVACSSSALLYVIRFLGYGGVSNGTRQTKYTYPCLVAEKVAVPGVGFGSGMLGLVNAAQPVGSSVKYNEAEY